MKYQQTLKRDPNCQEDRVVMPDKRYERECKERLSKETC